MRSYDKPVTVYLEFKELRNLEYRSIGDVTNSDTIRSDSLQINVWEGAGKITLNVNTYSCWANLHYGTADIVLSGHSGVNFYYQLGAGKIDVARLETDIVYMRNHSSNDMYIHAKNQLYVEIKGLGNVYYKGKPVISSNITGEGKLIPLE